MALVVRYILGFKLKKLLLIILLQSQPIYAHGNDYLFRQEAIEKEIAEFEANLAKDLADQAAQENDGRD